MSNAVKRRNFEEILTDLDDGRVHQQLTDLLPKLVQAVRENNKPGSLTLTLNVKLDRGNMARIDAKVSTKMPAPGTGPTLFYTDEEGNPTKTDPKQLPLRSVTPIKSS